VTSLFFLGALTGLPAVVLGHWLLHAPTDKRNLSPRARKQVWQGLGMGYAGIVLTIVLALLIYLQILLWRRVDFLEMP
jgi:prolipoprotein diacylglyceryltransferase